MSVKVTMEAPIPVCVSPDNEATRRWGVCALPRLWRRPDGSFLLRVNGEQDAIMESAKVQAPNEYFLSWDNGDTWEPWPEGDRETDMRNVTTIEPVFVPDRNGTSLSVRRPHAPAVIEGFTPTKRFLAGNNEYEMTTYLRAELPEECTATELVTWDSTGKELSAVPVRLDIPELEYYVVGGARLYNGDKVEIAELIPQPAKEREYTPLHSVKRLADGTLAGLVWGQNPEISDRFYGIVYFAVSTDEGRTWTKRGTVGVYDEALLYAYTEENSFAQNRDGSLTVVMRTEHCWPQEKAYGTPAMVSRSEDGGFTWTKPVPAADSSVTPHLVPLANGVLALVYGRPGVHMKYSEDGGKTWSEAYTVIGKTVEQHKAAGDAYMDYKYWNMDSYSNTFLFPVSEDTVLLCYNDMKFDPGDGVNHKAAMVRKIRFAKV